MEKSTSFSLDESFLTFIEDTAARYFYRNKSEVIRSALRLLEAEQARVDFVRDAVERARQDSAESQTLDAEAHLQQLRQHLLDVLY